MKNATKKLCPGCQKRRSVEFFAPRARLCEICKELKIRSKVVVSISELKKTAQKYFNSYIRRQDMKLGCISCGKKVEHAGHYMAQGSSGILRFDEDNVNGQCTACNVWKRGNLIEYRIALIKKIGEERVDALEFHRHDMKKWSREELEQIIHEYKSLSGVTDGEGEKE